MDYIHLLITFIISSLVAIVLTYVGGIAGGIFGCILLSLHNVWVCDLILAHRFKAGVKIFFQNMIVVIPVMLCFDQIFILAKTGEVNIVQFLSYFILTPVIIMAVFNWHRIVNFNLSEYLADMRERRFYLKKREKDEHDKIIKENEFKKLESAYAKAEETPSTLKEYFSTSKKMIRKSKFAKSYAQVMSFYTSKLILKGLDTNDSKLALDVFNHYIEYIFPYTGSDYYQTNIIGNSLGLAIKYNHKEVGIKVFKVLLEDNFDIRKIDNNLILYNLACWYSVNKEKESMLAAIRQGVKHGKQASQYMGDSDFMAYHDDADFLKAINLGNRGR